MMENEFTDILSNIGVSGLEENRDVMDESTIEAEIRAIIAEEDEEYPAKVEMHISMLAERMKYDMQQAYRAGIEEGIRLCKWIKDL